MQLTPSTFSAILKQLYKFFIASLKSLISDRLIYLRQSGLRCILIEPKSMTTVSDKLMSIGTSLRSCYGTILNRKVY